jgi:aerobic carbon-monoxide dehydrogenase small subunit
MSPHTVRFELNGQSQQVEVPAHRLLLDLLRDDLDLTGTKEGCTIGVCGICSVLVDGAVMSACLLPVVALDGARITTIEGLAPRVDELSPLQDAFIRYGGFQCGICTPGQIVSATALLNENPAPTRDEIRHWMMGNLCRCTGYYKIVESIEAAAAVMRGEQPPPPSV